MANQTGQIVPGSPQHKLRALKEHVNDNLSKLGSAIRTNVDPRTLARIAFHSVERNPRLLDCTPTSFLNALLECAQIGLEPDSTLGQAFLVPMRNNRAGVTECQLWPGYKGLLLLAYRSRFVKNIYVRSVYDGDYYEFTDGTTPSVKHRRAPSNTRGELTHVYGVVQLTTGGMMIDQMDRAEIEAVMKQSPAIRGGANQTPWHTNFDAMAEKTLAKRLCKWIPQSPDLGRAIAMDDRAETGAYADAGPIVTVEEPKPSPEESLPPEPTAAPPVPPAPESKPEPPDEPPVPRQNRQPKSFTPGQPADQQALDKAYELIGRLPADVAEEVLWGIGIPRDELASCEPEVLGAAIDALKEEIGKSTNRETVGTPLDH